MHESKRAEIIDLFKSARVKRKVQASAGIDADVRTRDNGYVAMNCQTHVHVYGFDPTRDALRVHARGRVTVGGASKWWLLALAGLLLLAASATVATTLGFVGVQPPPYSPVTHSMGRES